MLVMIAISLVLAYLAIVKKFEPLLLLPISFGMLLTNLPGAEMFHEQLFAGGHVNWDLLAGKTVEIDGVATTISAGLIDYLYLGVKLGIYPCLIFMGVGAGTDFEPLLANPKTLLLGAAAQLGIFIVFILAAAWWASPRREAGSIGIIGGADGPTAIYTTIRLAPHLLGSHRGSSVFLHGAGARDSAAHHARADHAEGARNRDEAPAQGKQDRKDHVPLRGNDLRGAAGSLGCASGRLPDAGQPDA